MPIQRFCTMILIFLAIVPAWAGQIEGTVEIRGSHPHLRTSQSEEPLRIYGTTNSVNDVLDKLELGDYVAGVGNVHLDHKIVALQAIDVVGLRKVLGVWRTAEWEVFEFRDFNQLNLYYPNAPMSTGVGFAHLRQMNYSLAPSSAGRWQIFLADKKTIHVGSLQIKEGGLTIDILNTDNGQVAESIVLKPIGNP